MAIISILSSWIVIALSNPEPCQTGSGRKRDEGGGENRLKIKAAGGKESLPVSFQLAHEGKQMHRGSAVASVLSERCLCHIFIFSSFCAQR